MLKYLRGTRRIEITGADPEACLNALTFADLPFWALSRADDFSFRCCVYERDWVSVCNTAKRKQCQAKTLEKLGLRASFAGLKKRPLLVVGVAAAILTAMWLQNYMWFFRVEGTQMLEESEILRQLSAEGVRFGAWGVGLDTEDVKNRMLLRLPQLRWLAVNREGGVVHVLVAEREPEAPSDDFSGVYNVVAARDGIITDIKVYNGFAAVKPGDAVSRGQLLVSGLADWTTHTQATHAEAEVYAKTLRTCRLLTPSTCWEKRYTGRTELCKTIIFQRNRRKISGNSSIFGSSCDKMIKIEQLTLPGGYSLPIWLETVMLAEYELQPVKLPQSQAEELLRRSAQREIGAQMLAGQILSSSFDFSRANGAFRCNAQLFCTELISRSVPVYLFGEEETNGETH